MKVQEIREIIKLINQTTINEFEYEHEGTKIKIIKGVESENQVIQQLDQTMSVVPAVQPVAQQKGQAELKEEKQAVVEEHKKQTADVELHKITSPMVGTFYESSSPDEDPYIKVGDKVKKDSIVCIVEAMKLFNEIEAEVSGEIVEILVENGQLVEYGQPLFLVKAE